MVYRGNAEELKREETERNMNKNVEGWTYRRT
jgi:hypothetical protein